MGRSCGGTRLVTHERRKFDNIGHGLESSRTGEATSGCYRGAAVEADANGELQLKRTQSRSSS